MEQNNGVFHTVPADVPYRQYFAEISANSTISNGNLLRSGDSQGFKGPMFA